MDKDVMYVCVYICTYTHTHNGILVIKKNEVMPFAATCMGLEIDMLSKESQIEKYKYFMISLICVS